MRRLLIVALFLSACASNPTTPTSLPDAIPAYDRDEWNHWIDADGDCLNTRHEVLQEESLIPATVEDCAVTAGQWRDLYDGTVYTDPSILVVDHFVPLAVAHESGGWVWSAQMKEDYANDLASADHLVAVHQSINRSKGSRGPDEWLPDIDRCSYVETYLAIKARWVLTVSAEEQAARQNAGCP